MGFAKRKKRNKLIAFILLLVLALLAAVAAGTSVSRYVFDYKDKLTGTYTTLYFSHNGEGSTAIMDEVTASNSYEGYLSLTAYNWRLSGSERNISARRITYRVLGLNDISSSNLQSETENGVTSYFLVDDWGTRQYLDADIVETSRNMNYTVTSVDESGAALADTVLSVGEDAADADNITEADMRSNAGMLKITRNDEDKTTFDGGAAEQFYVIIETQTPYREYFPFVVNASTAKISVATTVSERTHFGYTEVALNIETASSYTYTVQNEGGESTEITNSSPARVTVEWTTTSSAAAIFDYGRFTNDSEGNFAALESDYANTDTWGNAWYVTTSGTTTTLTLYMPQASNVRLYFYVPENYVCTVKAYFKNDGTGNVAKYGNVAGVNEQDIAISR